MYNSVFNLDCERHQVIKSGMENRHFSVPLLKVAWNLASLPYGFCSPCTHQSLLFCSSNIITSKAVARIFVWGLTSSPLLFPSPHAPSFPSSFPSPPFSTPSPLLPHKSSPAMVLGERCKLLQQSPGWSHKCILTHLRLSKRISWQHLSVVFVQCQHLHDGSSRYVFVDLSREKNSQFFLGG